jgi:hypothetical protein
MDEIEESKGSTTRTLRSNCTAGVSARLQSSLRTALVVVVVTITICTRVQESAT